jgi:hypothetical protein
VVALNDGHERDRSLCELPVLGDDPVARCMAMIRPEEVAAAVERYYLGGTLTY